MLCLERDCDEGISFSTHFLVIGKNWSWWGLNFLIFLFHLVNSFILSNKCGGDLGMLMYRLVSFTYVMIKE
jgi:hypothetical protein